MKPRTALVIPFLLIYLGCATAAPSPHGVAANAPAGPAPDDLLDATVWYNLALESDLVAGEIYRNARERLLQALADPNWDALPREERTNSAAGLPPAVILDVDETALDCGSYETELILSGREYDDASWAEWCRKEIAPAVPGAVEFTRFAAAHGVTVFYLTNRARDLGGVTLDNLRKAGFPVANDGVFLGLGALLPGCEQIGSDKGCRRRLVGRDYRVLMQFGDQIGDFVDVTANTLDGRRAAMHPYLDWVGERWWVLPNPTYGSWVPALFNNQWQLPREERRRLKIEALQRN